MSDILIADSGSTKCEWCLVSSGKTKKFLTKGISPYFLSRNEIVELLNIELLPKLKQNNIENIFYYGTGLKDNNNKRILHSSLKKIRDFHRFFFFFVSL